MSYTRTQVYLDPEDHRRLAEIARTRGISLTALIREIVSAFTHDREPRRPHGVADLIGFAEGETSDVAGDQEVYQREALETRLAKKLGRTEGSPDRRRSSR